MRKAMAGIALAAAMLGVGVAAQPAMADPSGFYLWGYYPNAESCDAAGKATVPAHGPVYLCLNNGGTVYALWVH
ncbi:MULTISPECIES: hypothetical protein [Embleya]|uniref:Secreted protein n=1 Tax=Embleya hyalina TaxID=516124 RepID=A0A401YXN1_9ACTN|nr:hypothetical protein [Embleya hyalina]GCD99377.1 hypothetical protein EHYA_07097 [Embleya hyalina]